LRIRVLHRMTQYDTTSCCGSRDLPVGSPGTV